MSSKNDKNKKPTTEAMKGYDRTDRDFQRTEKDIDNVSKSEKDTMKEKSDRKNHNN